MAHITDYVKWRGDLTLKEKPFNIVDNLIFCHLAYIDMTEAFTDEKELTVRQLWDRLSDKVRFRLITRGKDDKRLFEACADSERFGNIRVSDYVDVTDSDKQFAAMTFHLSDEEALIVYRGTDDTIVGWKEDFMMSYTKVPAQKMALEYAQEIIKKYPRCYLSGHSKGANLALFSAAFLSEDEFSRVEKIYLNDGPGFCEDVLDINLIKKIDPKCVRITPEYCIVGEIFEPAISESYIVKSDQAQLLQHGLLSWKVEGDKLELSDAHDSSSEQITKLFDSFIEKMDQLQNRQAFVNSIFDTMASNGAVTIEDFTREGPKAFENLIVTVMSKDEYGFNPLQNVKENVMEDVKNSPLGQMIEDKRDKKSFYRILGCLLGATLCFVVPENLIKTTFAIGIFIVVAFEVYLTLKYLHAAKWDFAKEKLRVNVSIVLVVAYAILIVKDDALFLFASILFGIFFLVCAYQSIIRFKASKGDTPQRVRFMFEAILTFIFGGYLMVGPEVGVDWYTLSIGSFFVLDAVFEIIHLLRVRKKFKG